MSELNEESLPSVVSVQEQQQEQASEQQQEQTPHGIQALCQAIATAGRDFNKAQEEVFAFLVPLYESLVPYRARLWPGLREVLDAIGKLRTERGQ